MMRDVVVCNTVFIRSDQSFPIHVKVVMVIGFSATSLVGEYIGGMRYG